MILQTNLLYLFLSLFLSALIYPFLINLLYKFQFREKVREFGPKTHFAKVGTPTMGGIGFFLVTLILNFFLNFSLSQTFLVILIFTLGALLGLLEDVLKAYSRSKLRENIRIEVYDIVSKSKKTWVVYRYMLIPWNLFREFVRIIGSNGSNRGVILKSHYKFMLHLSIGAFLGFWSYYKLGWDSMQIPFYGDFNMGIFYPIFITLFFVFTLNATAITDGVDSLLAGISMLIIPVYWVIALNLEYFGISNFLAILLGSLVVYLYFNIFPARVFMGDVGSYAIAGALFVIPFVMRVEFLILITHLLCLFDGGISGILQQFSVKIRKKRIFKMAPIHHHFELLGWPETKVTIRFWLVQLVLSLAGLLCFFYIV